MTDESVVLEQLREVVDPCSAATGSNLNIVELGLVKSVDISGQSVGIELRLTTPACHMVPYFHEEIESSVGSLEGVHSVELTVDNGLDWSREMMSESGREKQRRVTKGSVLSPTIE